MLNKQTNKQKSPEHTQTLTPTSNKTQRSKKWNGLQVNSGQCDLTHIPTVKTLNKYQCKFTPMFFFVVAVVVVFIGVFYFT